MKTVLRAVFFTITIFFVQQLYAAASSARLVPQQSDLKEDGLYYRSGITFSQDNRTVAVAGGGVNLWSASGYFLRHLGARYYPLEWPPARKRERGTRDDVVSTLFLRNGRELAAVSIKDNKVRFYDTLTGELTRSVTLRGEGAAYSIALSPDEKRLAIGTTNGYLELWDLQSNTFIRKIEAPAAYITKVDFLGNGRDIVASALDLYRTTCGNGACRTESPRGRKNTAISVWDASGALRKTVWRETIADCPPFSLFPGRDEMGIIVNNNIEILDKNLDTITDAAIAGPDAGKYEYSRILFSPDGKAVILAGKKDMDLVVSVFACPGFEKIAEYRIKSPADAVKAVAFSPDSKLLGITGGRGTEVVMAGSGDMFNRLEKKSDIMSAVATDPHNKLLASGNPVRMWDWTGAWLPNFHGYIYAPAFERSKLATEKSTGDMIAKTPGGDVRITDMGEKMAALFSTLPDWGIKATQMVFTNNGRYLFFNSETGAIRVMNLEGKIVSTIPAVRGSPMALSRGNLFAFLWPDDRKRSGSELAVLSLKTGTTEYLLPSGPNTAVFGSLDPEGKYLAWGNRIWDLPGHRSEVDFRSKVLDVSFESRLVATIDMTAKGVDLSVLDWQKNEVGNVVTDSYSRAAKFIKSGEEIVVGYYDGAIELRKTQGLELVKRLTGHSQPVIGLALSPDEKYLVSVGEDNVVTVWNLENFQSYSRISRDDEWAIYTPDGYFDASPHGGDLLAMVKGLDAYPVDQFAAERNRPDLILERMGLGTPELLGYYQSLYQKRLKTPGAAGIAAAAELNAPEAKITGVTRQAEFATVDFELSDSKSQLQRCLVYVNDTPIFGKSGRVISGKHYKGSEKIELNSGKNKIEVSGVNEAGVESYRALAYVDSKGRKGGELYYLAFGVSKYKDPKINLNYADKDAKDLEDVIRKLSPRYDRVHVKVLLNSEVTAANIAAAKDFLKNSKARDTVVLFLAGHGGYDKGKAPKYYFLPYEADTADLQATGVDFDTIESLLNDIQARKKLFLLDTCDSGELDEDTFANYYKTAVSRGIEPRTYRKPLKGRGQTRAKVRDYLYKKDRFIYNNLSKRSGAVVFSSSRGGEMSYESSSIKNGFFTSEILKAFTDKAADKNDDKRISSDELKEYVSQAVAGKTGELQHPSVDRDNLFQGVDFPSLAY